LEAPLKKDVQYINFQVFPASLVFAETGKRLGDQFKVIATDKYFIVYSDYDVVEFLSEFISFEKVDYKTYVAQTSDGEITVKREDNCGCGNRLKGYHPFVGVREVARYPFLKGT